MKNLVLCLFSLVIAFPAFSQLKAKLKCPEVEVDILDGRVNGMRPSEVHDRIKLLLPCFSSALTEKDSASKCGSVIYYKDKDITFYTDRDYIDIGPKFSGKLSFPLMGAPRNQLLKVFGNAKITDDKWEAYQTTYGIIVIYFDAANKVNRIQIATHSTETLQLCE